MTNPVRIAICRYCNRYWTFNSGPPIHFSVITKWCPDCIAKVFPRTDLRGLE